jgi:undecaprenyl-diphosphatase
LNHQLFLLLNSDGHPGALLLMLARLLATGVAIAAAALPVGLWIWARRIDRAALLAVVLGVAVALGLAQALGALWYEPRPFMIGLGHTLMSHKAENSFPSDHATFMWSLGLGLVATGAAPRWGWATCLLGIAVAWARIFLGVHFPIDMLGSALAAVAGAAAARLCCPAVRRWAIPVADRLYERALDLLHLPPALFPRRIFRSR